MPRLPHPRTALSGYADARLPAWRRAVVEHHLRRCTRCAVEVAQVRALGDLLRTPPPPPPPALVDRLLALDATRAEPSGDRPVPDRPADAARPAHPPGPPEPPELPRPRGRAGVETASVLVAGVVVLGTVAAGATVTAATVPWPAASTRASLTSVLPRLWDDDGRGGAVTVPPVDNGRRP